MTKSLPRRRSILSLATGLGALAIMPSATRAQTTLPDKPVRIVVGFAAGSGIDQVARTIAPQLERRIGRHVTIENKPGDAGALSGELLIKGPKDGSMLAFMASTTLTSKLTVKNFPFDPLTDIAPISLAGTFQTALAASPKIGVATFGDYLKWLKDGDTQRRRLGYTGSSAFLEIFGLVVRGDIGVKLEGVSFRGSAALVNDLQDGRIPAGIATVASFVEHLRSGRLKVLMTSGRKRSHVTPDVPTAVELGYANLEILEWFGFFASPSVPAPLQEEWNRQIRAVLGQRELAARLTGLGLDVESTTQQEAAERLAAHMKAWKARIELVGTKPTD